MKRKICAFFIGALLFAACNKKEPAIAEKVAEAAKFIADPGCSKEIITDKPVKAGETGIVLPTGTKLCFTTDNLEIRVTLPTGYVFLTADQTERPLPVYATYTCNCSVVNSHCQVFYAEGMGFGCLQSSCSGSCTGRFTYGGYTVDRVVQISDKSSFFSLPEVQKTVAEICKDDVADYTKHSIAGISFYNVKNEEVFKTKAKCDCEGTLACSLKVTNVWPVIKIYFCEGPCNGCELTVN